jgi:Rho-type GTPase-activating protein 1/2
MSAAPAESRDIHKPQVQTSQSGQPSAQLEHDERRSAQHTPTTRAPSPHRTSRNVLPSPTSPSVSPRPDSDGSTSYAASPSSPAIVLPPEVPEAGPQFALSYLQRDTSDEGGSARSFLTPDAPIFLERSASFDDGARPLNTLLKNDASPPGSSLSVRLPGRAGKRNSINPAVTFNYEAVAAESNNKSSSAPQSPSSSVRVPDTSRALTHTDVQPQPSTEQATEGLSRRPSRKAFTESPASTSAVPVSMLGRSRSQKDSSSKSAGSVDCIRPPLHQNTVLERLPPRTHSLNASSQDPELLTRQPSAVRSSISARKSSEEKDRSKPGSSLSIDVEKSRTGYHAGKRPMSPAYKAASPAHKVDVPHGIESGTDTSDGEREPSTDERNRPSSQPPKEKEAISRRRPLQLDLESKRSTLQEESGPASLISSAGDADTDDESSPVERVSRSTFIAPAHPPIRVSISANGFQELLSLADPRRRSSLQDIEELLKLNQEAASRLDSSQSAASLNPSSGAAQDQEKRSSTPASNATPTTAFSYSSPADNSSVTTISAPSSQGHDDSFIMLEPANGAASDVLLRQRSIRNIAPTMSSRSSSELSHGPPASGERHMRLDSNASYYQIDASSLEPGAPTTGIT